MFSMRRLFLLSFMAAFLAITALVGPASNTGTAHAASAIPQTDTSHCSSLGTLIETDKLTANSTTYGYLNIYYNSANGYNCAETTSASATYGKNKIMAVELDVCKQTSSSDTCTTISYSKPYEDTDTGYYSYYAGPVGVNGKGHCIHAAAEINWNGYAATYNTGGASHCS
jgi:hypothetical protein